jgi:hypothetical protein
VNLSDPENPPRNADADAASDLAAVLASAGDVLRGGCAWALATVAAWLGWDASPEPRSARPEASVALRAIPGRARPPQHRAAAPDAGSDPAQVPGDRAEDRPVAADGRDELTVLVRDPRSVFVFWTLQHETAATRARLRTAEPGAIAGDALRVEAEEDGDEAGAQPSLDAWTIRLAPGATSAHVDLLRPRRRVRITLGIAGEAARFVPLVASQRVALPWAEEGPAAEPRWRRVGAGPTGAEPPVPPAPEACALLAARAAESHTATSSTLPIAHHLLGLERGAGAAGPAS